MNQSTLIHVVALNSGVPHDDVQAVIKETFKAIANAIAAGDSVPVKSFGTFTITKRKSREWTNLRTGQREMIGAMRCPLLRAADALKAKLNSASAVEPLKFEDMP